MPGEGEGAARRAAGELEAQVLSVLWTAGTALNAGEVQERLTAAHRRGAPLAYSTVVTTLTRLHAKGVLTRERTGHAFHYLPVVDEAGWAASRMRQVLDATDTDRDSVLTRFISTLSDKDEELLRRLFSADDGTGPHDAARRPRRGQRG
jgi:predicted transcriptional regulator